MLYLEAGGAHGDAHIGQQGAEVFPFERPGPAFDQDVPPAHGTQHRATHLDGDKVRAALLFGNTDEHIHILLWTLSFHLVQLVGPAGGIFIATSPLSFPPTYLEAHFGCERVFLFIIQTVIHPQSLQL